MFFEGFRRMTPHMDSFFLRRFKKIRLILILHKKKLQVQCFFQKSYLLSSASAIYPCNRTQPFAEATLQR